MRSQLVSRCLYNLALLFGEVCGSSSTPEPENWSELVSKVAHPHSCMDPSETMGFNASHKLLWLCFAMGHHGGDTELEGRRWIQRLKLEKGWNENEVTQSCPTLCNPMNCSQPGSLAHGSFQARVLEWVVISFSRGSSWPRSPALQADTLTSKPPGKLEKGRYRGMQ